MLFHATQSHDYSICHAHDEERYEWKIL